MSIAYRSGDGDEGGKEDGHWPFWTTHLLPQRCLCRWGGRISAGKSWERDGEEQGFPQHSDRGCGLWFRVT